MESQNHVAVLPVRQAFKQGPSYRYYVLSVLTVCYISNAIDRSQVLAASLQAIKREFNASDFQLGILSGLPFALFYSMLGVPLAALADRASRRNILAVAVAVWSAMTALCGLSADFMMLFVARVGTAIGEAGGSPPSHSLISDYFPKVQRGMAFSFFALAVPVGTSLGALIGGWGNQHLGWRATFVLVAVPGLALALLVRASVVEPIRGTVESTRSGIAENLTPSLSTALRFLWSRMSFRYMCVAIALHSTMWYAASSFNNAFLQRSHSMTALNAGYWISLFSLAGGAGTLVGGLAADRLSTVFEDRRWYFWVPALSIVASLPVQCIAYLASGMGLMVSAFFGMMFLSSMFFGPSFAMTQALAPLRMRSVATAVMLFVQTLIGQGLGPSLVGVMSDRLTPAYGPSALRYALVLIAVVNLCAVAYYVAASRRLSSDLDAM